MTGEAHGGAVVARFPVEAGHVLQFERALGVEPAGLPDGEECVPPTYLAAGAHFDPDCWLRPHPGTPWFGSGSGPGAAGTGRGLHAEQHYTFHRMPRVGDRLTMSVRPGRRWSKVNRRGLTLDFVEEIVEYRDEYGELLVTEGKVRIPEMPVDG